MHVREASRADAEHMSRILHGILMSWSSKRPYSPEHVIAYYIEHVDTIRCSVAVDDDALVLGFQSLRKATEGNPYDLPAGWGIIGTYVSPQAARKGVGKALFASSLQAAKSAGLSQIDATIGESNELGLAYYEAMGFRSYKIKPGTISKKYIV